MEDVNLRAMLTIGKFNINIDTVTTLGIEVSLAAVALGASCIEKHFTLDCNMEGPDHKASLEPSQLKTMIRVTRNRKALGSSIKNYQE